MADEFQFWRDAIAGNNPSIDADNPQSGYYKKRAHKDGPWLPVAIWRKDEVGLVARVGSNTEDPHAIWTYCADNPVSKEDAKHAFETGKWPSDAPTLGDNSGNITPLEILKDYIDTAKAWFSKAGKIDTQKAVDTAANYAAELARLKTNADKERDAKIRPHLDAQREINGEYKPAIEYADTLSKQIKRACDAFLIAEKKRLEEEARRKYEAERAAAEAERKRIEEERAKKMEEDPIAALTEPEPEPELPMPPPPQEPVKVSAGGQRGRKMGLRKDTVYSVTDFDAVYAWAKDNPKVREAVEKVAVQAAKAGVAVPGVSKEEVERAA